MERAALGVGRRVTEAAKDTTRRGIPETITVTIEGVKYAITVQEFDEGLA